MSSFNISKKSSGLIPAVIAGKIDDVKALITARADVNVKDSEGGSPLLFAAHYGFYNIAKTLLQSHADVNVEDNYKTTPLIEAREMKRDSLVKLFQGEIKIQEFFSTTNSSSSDLATSTAF